MEAINQVVRPHRMDDNNNEKNIIWQDVKEFVNSLNEEQLQQPMRYWGEEKAGGIFAISILQEDFINPSGECVEPSSTYEFDEDEPIVYPKGTILLDVNE